MCKIFVMTNMRQVEDLETTIDVISSAITGTEKDGFGYTIQGSEGLYGERTTEPRGFKTSFEREIIELPFLKPLNYNRFGVKTEPDGAGIFHGRTSTNKRNIENTHPINKDGWSLIHNGVVNNLGPKYKMQTTNDTEHVLHYLSTQGIKAVEKNLSGYYAIAAFDPKNQLHIFRDNIAPLHFAKIEELDTFVFATTKELISEVCGEMGWDHSIISEVKDNVYLIYNQEAELVHSSYIKPMGWTANESKHASKSLGFNITDDGIQEENGPSRSELYSDDEILFLDEVNNCADHSYKFFDYHEIELSFEEFDALDDNEKLYCTVVRSDGTVVNSQDYQAETIYQGYRGAV